MCSLLPLLENIHNHEVEGVPNISHIDGIDIQSIQKFLKDRQHEHTFIRGVFWICSFELFSKIILQIGLHYSIILVWTLILIVLSFLLLVQISQWINVLHCNIALLCKMNNSIMLSKPIKKILCVACINILYMIAHHTFIILYSVTSVFADVQYILAMFSALTVLHCLISSAIVYCEQKFYEQFENIIFQQTVSV